ncbi:tRNA pseudouridine(55) synthase TruB [Rickettsiales endosymbiont of Stachyamoeba lipophora]|uniref:tRNA pseudouridine(55) synthase TruB n=1 Tax=Rickettsiales endosymbiont of Stachyamoeba lipophora TaxID=2486578 RepID=UPI000F647BF0|nr:tRNA pseudouridine(55) synthase TruB [Rickettsiales endosymbiont of Stachyamoeba lipophora]AZL15191.1 tRNA pseudouridine(55) synthase TruB [Rickettsiales endosymbiont of Stachyamoeba lipophora]
MSDYNINSILLINKTVGPSSGFIINQLKRLIKPRKIGHAGTLDPFADGLLPVAVNEATKILEYITDTDKEYIFTIQFGTETDTQDNTGQIINTCDNKIIQQQLEVSLPLFTGKITQIPSKFSAIKINGQRSYNLARANIDFEVPSRQITIHSLKLLNFEESSQQATLKVACSKGTYVRTLGSDIAKNLGTYGYLIKLTRTKVGKFKLENAILVENFKEVMHNANLNLGIPISNTLDDIPVVELDALNSRRLYHGQQLNLNLELVDQTKALITYNQQPVAMIEYKGGNVKPLKVFNIIDFNLGE